MEKCARCGKDILPNERVVDDPCCGAPDCVGLSDMSHYACLPYGLRVFEDEFDDYDPFGYETYADYELMDECGWHFDKGLIVRLKNGECPRESDHTQTDGAPF